MESPVRVILAGCGGMSRVWLRYLTACADVELVGLVDPVAGRAAERAREFEVPAPCFTDIESALAGCGADLLCDTSVPDAHAGNAAAALAAGCDVFTEKPMTATMEEARRTAALARRHGRSYAIMQNRRYLQYVRPIHDLIAAGTLGRIGIVNADFYRDPRFDGDFRREMDSPLILDMAIHHFDQARCMTGADALAVTCHEFNPSWSWYRHGAGASAIFEMTDGLVFTYRGCWCASGRITEWPAAWRIVGERGTLTWDGENAPVIEVDDAEPRDVAATYTGNLGHEGCLDEMFAARAAGRESDTSYSDIIRSLALCHAAIASARRRARIEIGDPLA